MNNLQNPSSRGDKMLEGQMSNLGLRVEQFERNQQDIKQEMERLLQEQKADSYYKMDERQNEFKTMIESLESSPT